MSGDRWLHGHPSRPDRPAGRPYHRAMPLLFFVLIVAAVLVAVPVRRLVLDGYPRWAILGYAALILVLALGVTEARPLARYLLPLLGLAYIAPFITFGSGLDRLLGRRRPVIHVTPVATRAIEPPRDVTPREATPSDGTETPPHDRPGPSA
jgi:hypothetical protein